MKNIRAKSMRSITQRIMGKKVNKKIVSQQASEFGRLGGLSTAKKYGKRHMKAVGKKGAEARWGKK